MAEDQLQPDGSNPIASAPVSDEELDALLAEASALVADLAKETGVVRPVMPVIRQRAATAVTEPPDLESEIDHIQQILHDVAGDVATTVQPAQASAIDTADDGVVEAAKDESVEVPIAKSEGDADGVESNVSHVDTNEVEHVEASSPPQEELYQDDLMASVMSSKPASPKAMSKTVQIPKPASKVAPPTAPVVADEEPQFDDNDEEEESEAEASAARANQFPPWVIEKAGKIGKMLLLPASYGVAILEMLDKPLKKISARTKSLAGVLALTTLFLACCVLAVAFLM